MNPFYNSNDLQSLIENFTKPWVNGFPYTNGNNNFQNMLSDTLNKSMPSFFGGGMMNSNQNQPNQNNRSIQQADYKTFETHEFVLVRVTLPKQANTNNIRLLLDSHQLTVKGIHSDGSDLRIQLPAAVRPKYAKADYKDGILEVRLMKKGPESQAEIRINTEY